MSAGRGPPSSCRCRERSWRVTHSRGHAPFTTAQACGYQGSSKRSARPFISLFPTRAPRPCGLPPDTIRGGVHRFDAREGGGFGISLTYYEPEHVRQDLGGHRHLGKEVCRIWSPTQGLWNRRVQVADPAFGGEMRIPVSFTDTDEGIEVAMSFEDTAEGICLEDNQRGSGSSLTKRAEFAEGRRPKSQNLILINGDKGPLIS